MILDDNDYIKLFNECVILPEWKKRVENSTKLVLAGMSRYKSVANEIGIPWLYVGLAHLMESDCRFSRQILNGERWDQKTQLVPENLGPWNSWEEAALTNDAPEALRKFKGEWNIGRLAKELERLNGGGYLKRNKLSPYLWSGSQHGLNVGKYGSDGHYDSELVSDQVGAMVVLKYLVGDMQYGTL
jgi:lysozyme family protein